MLVAQSQPPPSQRILNPMLHIMQIIVVVTYKIYVLDLIIVIVTPNINGKNRYIDRT
jgi:hypothetical protein